MSETELADFMNELAWTRVQIHDLVELAQLLRDQLVLDETKLQTAQYELAKQILVLAELSRHLGRDAPMLAVQGKFTGTGGTRRSPRCNLRWYGYLPGPD